MNNLNASSSSDSTLVAVPKLCDDRSNWADYEPRIQNAMGAKGLWRHILGTATALVPYAVCNGIPMLGDGKTPATEDQIELKESKIIEFEKREYLAHHIILSTTFTRLMTKIKALKSAEDMWRHVIDDAMSKSTLHLLNAKDQLASMKLADNDDPKTHLEELRQHFQTMQQHHDNLLKIGLEMSDSRYNIIIMSSLLESYRSTLQTITTSQLVGKLSGAQLKALKADDIMSFIIKEAQHKVRNNDHTKYAESAIAAHMKKSGKSKEKGKGKEKNHLIATLKEEPRKAKVQCGKMSKRRKQ